MSFSVNTNLSSLNGQRRLEGSTTSLSTSMARLSSGIKVNSAKDDAAGLAIASGLTSQIRGMGVATRNAYDGISLIQTAEGALSSLGDTLQRMRELAMQSSSGAGVNTSDREKMQTEFNALNNELVRVVQNSEFNGKKILNGDLAGGVSIQVGATTAVNSRIDIRITNVTVLLAPVTQSTLSPRSDAMDATFASIVANSAGAASTDPQLLAAKESEKLANVAVIAAKLAVAAPNDIALATAASTANLAAANAISGVSGSILATSQANKTADLVSDNFLNSVTAANVSSVAAATETAKTDATVQSLSETNSNQATSLLTVATQLAESATAAVSFAGQNSFAVAMNSLTGDTLSDVSQTESPLNSAIARAGNGTFGADRNAQKAFAAHEVAKAIAAASYVEDSTQTQAANDRNKTSFLNSNELVFKTSKAIDSVAIDYSLSSIRLIDEAIDLVNAQRANLGSAHNPFETAISNLQIGIENQSAAKSRIMDADFAQETANLSRSQILQEAGTAMLAQANQSSQSVVALLK